MSSSLAPRATPFASNAARAGGATKKATREKPAARRARRGALVLRIDLAPAKAAVLMVVHHPGRLHEGVHDSRADELEAARLEVLGERVRDRVAREAVAPRTARPALDEAPQVAREAAELALHLDEAARVADRRVDLRTVAHYTGVGEQALPVRRAVAGDALGVELVESPAVVLALRQDRVPGEAGLRAFEDEKLEELGVVPERHAPFPVVVGHGEGIARPGAAPDHALPACAKK